MNMQKDKEEGGDEKDGAGAIPRRSREYDEEPPPSRTHDDTSHHSSPQPSDVQQHQFQVPKVGKSGQREITGGPPRRVEVPMHVTKHSEPAGRPKQTEGSERKSTRDDGDY
jgi:hypothetical protein